MTRKRKGILQTQRSSVRSKGFEPHFGHLSPGDGHWEGEPPYLVLKSNGALYQESWRVVGNNRHEHKLITLCPSTEARDCKVIGTLAGLPRPPKHDTQFTPDSSPPNSSKAVYPDEPQEKTKLTL